MSTKDSKKVTLLTISLAVDAESFESGFAQDELSVKLSENGRLSQDSCILDWSYIAHGYTTEVLNSEIKEKVVCLNNMLEVYVVTEKFADSIYSRVFSCGKKAIEHMSECATENIGGDKKEWIDFFENNDYLAENDYEIYIESANLES